MFVSCVLLAILSTTDGSGGGSERTTCFGLPFGYDIVAKVGIGNIKRIRSPQDMLGELSNFLVKMKKIVPSNLYEATFDHTLVLGIALDQHAFFPESLGEKELDAVFKIVGDYCDQTLNMSVENKQGFMEQMQKRMKALSVAHAKKKAEAAKKKTGGEDATESYSSATTRASSVRSSFMRTSAILDSGENVAEKIDNMGEFGDAATATINMLCDHVREFSMQMLSVLEAVAKHGDEQQKAWVYKALAHYESNSPDIKAAINADCIEKQFLPVHHVRFLVACCYQAYGEVVKPDIAAHNQVQAFGSIVMTKEDVSPQVLAARLERENAKLAKEDKYSELRLGTLLISAISKSPWDKAKTCYSKFEMAQAAQDWKPEQMTLGFIEKKMTAFFPKGEEKKPKAQVGADDEDSGPAAIAAGAQEDAKGGKGNGKGKNNAKETGGGGGVNRWKNTVCFVCGKTGHSYRGVRDNGKPWHKLEDIEAARAKETAQQLATPRGKGGKGNGGGGGGWKARSGGAAAVESDEMTIEELKSQLMEQKAAATEARLKLLESQAAARSQGLGP